MTRARLRPWYLLHRNRLHWLIPAIVSTLLLCSAGCSMSLDASSSQDTPPSSGSLADSKLEMPAWNDFLQIVSLQDYNVRIVILGTTLLGCAGGMVGSFTLLRKRALMGDALAHSTLPGIVIAYIAVTALGGDGKTMPVLLTGATISGLVGVSCILAISRWTRLKEDTALGAVLSVFFGIGVCLLSVSTQMQEGSATGLESFIYGKTASMGLVDIQLIAVAALVCIACSSLLFKEFKLLCFDDGFAGSRGFPVVSLDLLLMGLIVLITIVGLQAVGLILMIALLIIPAAAARFWTERLFRMFLIAGAIGGVSGWFGATVSALFSKLPSGAMIVLVCTAIFTASMIFGTRRGVWIRFLTRRKLNQSIDRQHLLRAMYELAESAGSSNTGTSTSVPFPSLLAMRSWSRRRLTNEMARSQRAELIDSAGGNQFRLTKRGWIEAKRLTRQHRLWELYLIHYAEVAPSRVDRDADAIEHVLEPEVVADLESLLEDEQNQIPVSPHLLGDLTEGERDANGGSNG
ncbi:MAG: iron chelate uptake ABC transporter family permease subunit [Aureliella sp.]